MTDVVIHGPVSWNHIVQLDALPRPESHMVLASGHHYGVGGTSAGKALHLTELTRSVVLHTVVGSDRLADLLEQTLSGAGIALFARRAPGPSEQHLNLMDTHGRRVSIYLELPAELTDLDATALVTDAASARALVMDLSAASRHVLAAVSNLRVPLWTDVHDYDGVAEFQRPFVDAASYVFCAGDRLGSPLEFLRTVTAGGARLAVCTLGAAGAIAVDHSQRTYEVPAPTVAKVVDSNGAGDGFFAGCLNAVLDGASVQDALEAGARQAARALSTVHLSPLLDIS
jgi:sugar/nucleoside kinase (ribokinase family)